MSAARAEGTRAERGRCPEHKKHSPPPVDSLALRAPQPGAKPVPEHGRSAARHLAGLQPRPGSARFRGAAATAHTSAFRPVAYGQPTHQSAEAVGSGQPPIARRSRLLPQQTEGLPGQRLRNHSASHPMPWGEHTVVADQVLSSRRNQGCQLPCRATLRVAVAPAARCVSRLPTRSSSEKINAVVPSE
jgi:hypothetical protein